MTTRFDPTTTYRRIERKLNISKKQSIFMFLDSLYPLLEILIPSVYGYNSCNAVLVGALVVCFNFVQHILIKYRCFQPEVSGMFV